MSLPSLKMKTLQCLPTAARIKSADLRHTPPPAPPKLFPGPFKPLIPCGPSHSGLLCAPRPQSTTYIALFLLGTCTQPSLDLVPFPPEALCLLLDTFQLSDASFSWKTFWSPLAHHGFTMLSSTGDLFSVHQPHLTLSSLKAGTISKPFTCMIWQRRGQKNIWGRKGRNETTDTAFMGDQSVIINVICNDNS